MKFIKSNLIFSLVIFGLFFLYAIALIHRLSTTPGIFLDEANYMNEVISKVNFGTDIHGLTHPVYFSSAWGQGQSVLYSWLAIPIIQSFGFSVFNFRLPFAVLTLTTLLCISLFFLFNSKNRWLTLSVTVALLSSPWFFTSGRWILDANTSPLFIMLALILLALALLQSKKTTKTVLVVFSSFIMATSAYGYIASWIYLPFLFILLAICLCKKNMSSHISLYLIILYGVISLIIATPLIAFAIHSNIFHSRDVSHFLWFSLPPLPSGRMESLISFKGNILQNIWNNIFSGFQMFLSGTDSLPWNGVAPFGSIMPWLLMFVPIGLLTSTKKLTLGAQIFHRLTALSLLAFIPCMLIITPNYNHWNFVMPGLAVMIGYGLYATLLQFSHIHARLIILTIPVVLFGVFLRIGYFGTISKPTFFKTQLVQYNQVARINHLMQTKYSRKVLFIDNLSANFMFYRLVQKPVTPAKYLSMQEKSANYLCAKPSNIGPHKRYGYLRDSSSLSSDYHYGDLVLANLNDPRYPSNKWHTVTTIIFNGQPQALIIKK